MTYLNIFRFWRLSYKSSVVEENYWWKKNENKNIVVIAFYVSKDSDNRYLQNFVKDKVQKVHRNFCMYAIIVKNLHQSVLQFSYNFLLNVMSFLKYLDVVFLV